MDSPRYDSLVKVCDLAMEEYSLAVRKLQGVSWKVAQDDWNLAFKLAQRARTKCGVAMDELQKHKLEHRC